MNVNNVNAGAVNWDTLLSKLGEVTKKKGADGVADTTNVTITTMVDGVETPVTISIPDDLDLPEVVDQAAIDSLCEKLAAMPGLGLTEAQISQLHDVLTATLTELGTAAVENSAPDKTKGAMFDLYMLMALLVEVAQKQRDASREMRQCENQLIQQSILNQSEQQRTAAITGIIASACCAALQIGVTMYALGRQAKAFNQQLGTDKTSGLDVARQDVKMLKNAHTSDSARTQLNKVKAEVQGHTGTGGNRVTTNVEDRFGQNNTEFHSAETKFRQIQGDLDSKTAQSITLKEFAKPQNIDSITSEMVNAYDGPEMQKVQTAVAKLEAFKAENGAKLEAVKAEVAKLDAIGLSPEDKQFVIDHMSNPTNDPADLMRMQDLQNQYGEQLGQINPEILQDSHLIQTEAQLKADVKAGFDEAIAKVDQQIETLKAELEPAKENYRSRIKIEVGRFKDNYDAALQEYNDLKTNGGTKEQIAAAEEKLKVAGEELKYARAIGYYKISDPNLTSDTAHLHDVEQARSEYNMAQNNRTSSLDYIKASNEINRAQAWNGLIGSTFQFLQSLFQGVNQMQQAEATKEGASQKRAEESLDQTRDLYNQAEELVNNSVQSLQAIRQAETQSMRDAIQA